MPSYSRRQFLQHSTAGAAGLLLSHHFTTAWPQTRAASDLQALATSLSDTWGQKLLSLQVTDRHHPQYGTIISPEENMIHGRMGECIYPFLHLAARHNDHRYVDAAMLLYGWMEKTVSQEDGSWLNEPEKGSWKGTTVFGSIALAEALKNHGQLLDNAFRKTLQERLAKAGDFIYNNFNIEYGNINYPVSSTYALALLADLLDKPQYREKAASLAKQAITFISKKDKLLTGEGTPYKTPSHKGCYSVDLGYNVEESLPNLVLYALHTGDQEVLEAVQESMQAHLQFMLPDGGWDNSWGTRNYKWTYWGSRTSDGCQPAYALLGGHSPEFYTAALRNTQLLEQHTHDGLLYGGPHYFSHGVIPSLHHTFCHLKAQVTILDHGIPQPPPTFAPVKLPREQAYGGRFFPDIQTGLVATGPYRATVTGYDRNYKDYKAGHASGGALSMLWHTQAGILLCASMNEYQLYEAHNMQEDKDPHSIPLTPRISLEYNGDIYTNINDFGASMETQTRGETIIVTVHAALVNKDQQAPATGAVACKLAYQFTPTGIQLQFTHNGNAQVKTWLPVISPSMETLQQHGKTLRLARNGGTLQVVTNKPLQLAPTTGTRIFNYVPGLEALPFYTQAPHLDVQLSFV